MVGWFVTPIPAGAHATSQGWRWSYYALAIALTGMTVLFVLAFEETKYIRPAGVRRPESFPGPRGEAGVTDEPADPSSKKTGELGLKHLQSTREAEVVPSWNTCRQRMRLTTTTDESLVQILIAPSHVIWLPHVLFTALQFGFNVSWLVFIIIMNLIFFSAPSYNFYAAGIGCMLHIPMIIWGKALRVRFQDQYWRAVERSVRGFMLRGSRRLTAARR